MENQKLFLRKIYVVDGFQQNKKHFQYMSKKYSLVFKNGKTLMREFYNFIQLSQKNIIDDLID